MSSIAIFAGHAVGACAAQIIGAKTSTQSEISCGCLFAGGRTRGFFLLLLLLLLLPLPLPGVRPGVVLNGRPARIRIISAVSRYDAPPATITNAAATSRAVNP
jgi:hypothetical protein